MKLLKKEFIYGEPLPTPECHASTIVSLGDDRAIAAWFGGTKEGEPDVMIWCSCYENGSWSTPKSITPEVGIQHWNPVLFRTDENKVTLYYKIGCPIPDWKTMYMTTEDGGKTWSEPAELVAGDDSGGRGPVKNKPVRISNGNILAPGSIERGPWRCFVDILKENGWEQKWIPAEGPDADELFMIQPSLWENPKGHIHALMRTNQGKIYRTDSDDYGESWSCAYPTDMPNNNSGLDCVMTEDGVLVLVCNPVGGNWASRSPLSVFCSYDNGKTFEKQMDLETQEGEYSYPAVIAKGNRLLITYTWKRLKVRYCEIEL